MSDPNSPEAVEARKNQEDPLVMYLVVRESLGMGMGKTAAQCAHAAQALTIKFWEIDEIERERVKTTHSTNNNNQAMLELFGKWLNSSYRKVVLKANENEWKKLKAWAKTSDHQHVVIVDAGLTEIAPNSETVIGVFPLYRSTAPKELSKLQTLK